MLVEGTTHALFNCGVCRSQWFVLMARGTPEDGIVLADCINTLSDQLSSNAVSIRAYAGRAAYSAIERALGQSAARIGGTPVNTTDRFGAGTLVVVGDSPTRNVQRLGGTLVTSTRAGYIYMCGEPEFVGRMPVRTNIDFRQESSMPVSPAPGSVWVSVGSSRGLVRVVDVSEGVTRFTTEIDGPVEGLATSVFLSEYRVTSFKEAVKADVRVPQLGETWWANTDDDPALITGVMSDETGLDQVTFQRTLRGLCPCNQGPPSLVCADHSAGLPFTMALVEFLKSYGPTMIEARCNPGEEWIDPEEEIVLVHAVRMERREVICISVGGRQQVVSFRKFAQGYRKMVRKSVYELLDEDELDA